MKKELKFAGIAMLVMAGAIAGQIGLTYLFTFRVGEIFLQTTLSALILYVIFRSCRRSRERRAAKRAEKNAAG